MLNVTRELVVLEDEVSDTAMKTLPVRVRATLRLIEDDLAALDIERSFESVHGSDLWPAVRKLGDDYVGAWSIGKWPETAKTATTTRRLRLATR